MSYLHATRDQGFDRLQVVITELRAGERLSSAEAARLSGLTEDLCRAMLEGLVRAGLMSDTGQGSFVRKRLDDLTR
jgi:hypothetical protein